MSNYTNKSIDAPFYQYTAAKPVKKGVYECIDFANNHVMVFWDGEKFEVPDQKMIKFFKSNEYKQDKLNIDDWSELR